MLHLQSQTLQSQRSANPRFHRINPKGMDLWLAYKPNTTMTIWL